MCPATVAWNLVMNQTKLLLWYLAVFINKTQTRQMSGGEKLDDGK